MTLGSFILSCMYLHSFMYVHSLQLVYCLIPISISLMGGCMGIGYECYFFLCCVLIEPSIYMAQLTYYLFRQADYYVFLLWIVHVRLIMEHILRLEIWFRFFLFDNNYITYNYLIVRHFTIGQDHVCISFPTLLGLPRGVRLSL